MFNEEFLCLHFLKTAFVNSELIHDTFLQIIFFASPRGKKLPNITYFSDGYPNKFLALLLVFKTFIRSCLSTKCSLPQEQSPH